MLELHKYLRNSNHFIFMCCYGILKAKQRKPLISNCDKTLATALRIGPTHFHKHTLICLLQRQINFKYVTADADLRWHITLLQRVPCTLCKAPFKANSFVKASP